MDALVLPVMTDFDADESRPEIEKDLHNSQVL